MALTPDDLKKIQEEELERYKTRRRLEAFDSLQGEERELAEGFSAELKSRYAEADFSGRRSIMRKAQVASMPKKERERFEKLKQAEQDEILALERPERSARLAEHKAPQSTKLGCWVIVLMIIAASIFALTPAGKRFNEKYRKQQEQKEFDKRKEELERYLQQSPLERAIERGIRDSRK